MTEAFKNTAPVDLESSRDKKTKKHFGPIGPRPRHIRLTSNIEKHLGDTTPTLEELYLNSSFDMQMVSVRRRFGLFLLIFGSRTAL